MTLTPGIAQEIIPRLGELYDEPFGDASAIPTALLCGLTRKHVTVALSGDGGDEVFGGYKRYRTATSVLRFHGMVPGAVRRSAARAFHTFGEDRLHAIYMSLEERLPKAMHLANPSRQLKRALRLLQTDNDVRSVYQPLVAAWAEADTLVARPLAPELVSADLAEQLSPLRALMLTDLTTYLPDDVLVKVDRASMAASLEVRSPILDHRIVEWSWSLPDNLVMSRGGGKVLLKKLLNQFLPDVPDRPKMGFAVALDDWLRQPLREWAEDLLCHDRLRADGIFNADAIERVWKRHVSRQSDEQLTLWPILMFQSWRHAGASTPVGAA
jgi:asparagine synthase (glutamine-hydrolysing)